MNSLHVTHKTLSTADLFVIGLYFCLVFAIGFYFSRKERTSTDYFLAGRNVGWFAIGASLFVSNISTEHFIGLAGSGASSGLAVGHFEWLACFMLLILGWVFVPFYLRSNVFTMPEFLERRFNRACATYLASISILAYVFTKISVHLYAAAVVLERVVGWSPLTAAVVLVIATGIYTIAGGLAAVIYTDLVQTLILIVGAVILTVLGLDKVGGFSALRAALPADYFHMMKPASDPNFPWTGIFFGAPILGIWYWCTDQVIVQRVLSAKTEGHAKLATIFAGFLKILPVFMLVLPGLIAFALYRDLFKFSPDGNVTNPDIAYPTMIVNLLPSGLVGIYARHARFLQKVPSERLRKEPGEFRARRHRIHGSARLVVGAVHSSDQQSTLHLPAERAGLHQPAHCRMFRLWHSLAAVERHGRHFITAHGLFSGCTAFCDGTERSCEWRTLLHVGTGRMAGEHELPSLCDFHVRSLLNCSRGG